LNVNLRLSLKKNVTKMSQNSRNEGFPNCFCLIMEGSGSGSSRPKNIRIRIPGSTTLVFSCHFFLPSALFTLFLSSFFFPVLTVLLIHFSHLSLLFHPSSVLSSFLCFLRSISASYLFSRSSFRILISSLPLSCIYCRPLQSITD
jgi:hypothetical protein